MLVVARLSMPQDEQQQASEQHQCPQGRGDRPGGPSTQSIRLTGQEWTRGPQGQMSLGEMLQLAGYP
eukprot:3367145-Karenia_brevis.AAC.1